MGPCIWPLERLRNVWYGSVTCYDAACFQRFTQIYEIYPQVGGMDPRPLSEVSCHTLVTDIIEVADDGQSARAYFLTPGLIYSTLNGNQKKALCLPVGALWCGLCI